MIERTDDWANPAVGFGTSGDKHSGTTFRRRPRLGRSVLTSMYEQSPVVARVVDKIADDAFRPGPGGARSWALTGLPRGADKRALMRAIDALALDASLLKVIKWGNLYGGSLGMLPVLDGLTPDKPLDMSRVRAFFPVQAITAHDAIPYEIDAGFGSPTYLQVLSYDVTGLHTMPIRVHHSRALRYEPIPLPYEAMIQSTTRWGPGVVERLFDDLAKDGAAPAHALSMMYVASVLYARLEGYRAKTLTKGGKGKAREILVEMRRQLDSLGIMGLDEDDEDDEDGLITAVPVYEGEADLRAQVEALAEARLEDTRELARTVRELADVVRELAGLFGWRHPDELRRTLSAAQAWDLTGPGSASPDEQDPTLRRHAAACKAEIDPSRPRLITGCELAREFGEQIAGTGLETLKVLGDSGEDLSLVEAFEAIVDEQDIFRELLTDALIATRALTNATGISEDPVRELDALIGGPDYVYDPLEGLDAATLLSAARARRVPKASQKALDALVGQGRADLVRGVWAQRQALVERQVWLHFPASAGDSSDRRRARLKSFLQADAAPKLVKITAGDRARAASRVGGTPGKEVADAAAKLLRAQPDITELRAMPGWSSSGGAQSIESYLTLLARIELRHRQVTEARAELDALLSAGPDGTRHPAYARFLERVRSIKKIQSPTGDFTDDPDFASRFPLYATAELGVALALLPVRGQGPRVEPMTYFGVNLYFAPLDKDEPLTRIIDRKDWSGRTFLRRFSLMAGVSILRGDLNQELGVNGVLNRQFLLGGFGVRWTDYLRFGLGATLYRQDSPNPLSDRRTLRAAPYLSAGIDIDIIGQINKWYRLRNQ